MSHPLALVSSRVHITHHIDPSDDRRRYLTDHQIFQLAQLHHYILMVDTNAIQSSQIERLEREIAEFEGWLDNNEGPRTALWDDR